MTNPINWECYETVVSLSFCKNTGLRSKAQSKGLGRNQSKGSFRLAACGCESAADCGKDIYFWRQTVAFLQGDRKFPIYALTQPTADACGKSSNVNKPLEPSCLDEEPPAKFCWDWCSAFGFPCRTHKHTHNYPFYNRLDMGTQLCQVWFQWSLKSKYCG